MAAHAVMNIITAKKKKLTASPCRIVMEVVVAATAATAAVVSPSISTYLSSYHSPYASLHHNPAP